MNRNVRALALALLCVLAVALAASTLANPQSQSGAGLGTGDSFQQGGTDQGGDDDSDRSGAKQPEGGSPIRLGAACVPVLLSPGVQVGGVVALAGTFYALQRRDGFPYALAVVFPLTLFLGIPYLLLTDCGNDLTLERDAALLPDVSNNSGGGEFGGNAGGQAADQLLSPTMLVGLLVVVAVAFAVLAYRASGDDEGDDADPVLQAEPAEPEDRAALAAVGSAAGEAADRIEDAADVENEVYRAWRDMTDHVDVPDPETSTPREFATAAGDAGMDATHVDALTELFREVRYGGAEATADREERAVDALRAIEDRYAPGGDR